MRQTAKRNLDRPKQATTDAHDGTQASPAVGHVPMTASTHLSSPVVLPLMSESKKLLWVEPHQINLHPDGVAELNKAFDRFPYLTDRQTASLAQRCSLHPDKVKVWFMAQRLLCGISWDYSDIFEMLSKFKFSQADAEVTKGCNDDRRDRKQGKEKVQECGEEKRGEKESTKEKETPGQNVSANKQMESDVKQKQLMKQEKSRKVGEDKINTQKKRRRMPLFGKRKRRKRHDNKGIMVRAAKAEVITGAHWVQKCTKAVQAPSTKKKRLAKKILNLIPLHENPLMLDIPVDINSLFILKPQSQTNPIPPNANQTDLLNKADGPHNISEVPKIPINSSFEGKGELDSSLGKAPQTSLAMDVEKPKELTKVNNTSTQPPANHDAPPHRPGCHMKTEIQLQMLRLAFLTCQYPSRDYYRDLEVATGISCQILVQWFADMRYSVKRSQPRWMNQEQHKQALATIKYRQCMKTLAKEHQTDDCPTKMMTFEGGRSYEEGESVKE